MLDNIFPVLDSAAYPAFLIIRFSEPAVERSFCFLIKIRRRCRFSIVAKCQGGRSWIKINNYVWMVLINT